MHQHYNQTRTDIKEQAFYKTPGWKRTKEQVLIRDNYMCQHCFKNKIIKPAETVHHIKFLKTHWHLRLTMSNLISLCKACHNTIHKGKEEES
jgi:5-methylcytosine-specific restriction protein A